MSAYKNYLLGLRFFWQLKNGNRSKIPRNILFAINEKVALSDWIVITGVTFSII